MKIFVVSRNKIKKFHKKDPMFHLNNWIISIFSSPLEDKEGKIISYSPIPTAKTVLKLQFDDVTEQNTEPAWHFNSELAKQIVSFIKQIKDDGTKDFFVHCDAGVSRSGAVGFLLNKWFNKFINRKPEDDKFFKNLNPRIMPNPEVIKILENEMFGLPINGWSFNEDEEKEEK